jgi:hypothetical protein
LLAKKPEARLATPAEVVAALEPFTAGGALAGLLTAAGPAPAPAGAAEDSGSSPAQGPPAPVTPALPARRRLAVAAGLAGLGLAAGIYLCFRPTTGVSPGPPPPLKGSIDLRVWDDQHPLRRDRRLNQEGALPLKPGDQVRIEARLNRPAYVYLLLIGTTGRVDPLYPWEPGEWDTRPADEEPIDRLDLPEAPNKGWRVKAGEPGMETLILLAREAPLGRDVDLAVLLRGIPRQREQHLQAVVWFENGEVVRDEPERAFAFFAEEINDPVLQTQALLKGRLQRHFSYSRAVSYAHRGK